MGCMSHRRPHVEVRPEQKWDYISLNDFKSTSCFTPLAYAYLWLSLLISTAVYAVDTFTAVNLLAFNKWSSSINPSQLIGFDVSKWIFSICIILSFVNVGFEHIRARRIMNRGSVAECYLDNLAVRLESTRLGSGRGWKRFLVFAELTKSKKGAEYVALFTYFNFQSWFRVLLCSGPRQAVNALTLWQVYNAKLQVGGDNFENSLANFFHKIKVLAAESTQQSVILCGMIFTLVIWVFSILSLALAAMFFVFFLWHYIPRTDGGLSGYCERKANKRLMSIVSVKINKAMAEEERKRRKAEFKEAKKKGGDRPTSMKATLPNIEFNLHRNDTMTTLPAYASRPGTAGSIEMNLFDQNRPLPSRTATTTSTTSFSSAAPLLGAASEFGRSASPAPTMPSLDLSNYPPTRTGTPASSRGFGAMPAPAPRGPFPGPLGYPNQASYNMPQPRSPVNMPNNGYRGRPGDDFMAGRASPAPSAMTYRSAPVGVPSPQPRGSPVYPPRSVTNPLSPRGPYPYPPQRNMTAPFEGLNERTNSLGSQRSAQTAPPRYNQRPDPGGFNNPTRPGMGNRPGPRGGYGGASYGSNGPRGPRYS